MTGGIQLAGAASSWATPTPYPGGAHVPAGADGRVHYYFDNAISAQAREAFNKGVSQWTWADGTPIFVEGTQEDSTERVHYVGTGNSNGGTSGLINLGATFRGPGPWQSYAVGTDMQTGQQVYGQIVSGGVPNTYVEKTTGEIVPMRVLKTAEEYADWHWGTKAVHEAAHEQGHAGGQEHPKWPAANDVMAGAPESHTEHLPHGLAEVTGPSEAELELMRRTYPQPQGGAGSSGQGSSAQSSQGATAASPQTPPRAEGSQWPQGPQSTQSSQSTLGAQGTQGSAQHWSFTDGTRLTAGWERRGNDFTNPRTGQVLRMSETGYEQVKPPGSTEPADSGSAGSSGGSGSTGASGSSWNSAGAAESGGAASSGSEQRSYSLSDGNRRLNSWLGNYDRLDDTTFRNRDTGETLHQSADGSWTGVTESDGGRAKRETGSDPADDEQARTEADQTAAETGQPSAEGAEADNEPAPAEEPAADAELEQAPAEATPVEERPAEEPSAEATAEYQDSAPAEPEYQESEPAQEYQEPEPTPEYQESEPAQEYQEPVQDEVAVADDAPADGYVDDSGADFAGDEASA
ncbi:hypothetical protein [Streptomyces sp. NPDC089919]|uniref:hypothetical protein n=1 Tax=Streptomyces sp. NPDC089919 TaxID=3155188 RepID=UPI00344A956B